MNEPKPIAEAVYRHWYGNHITIETISPDFAAWLEIELPRFGEIALKHAHNPLRVYSLHVSELFRMTDIFAYLEAHGAAKPPKNDMDRMVDMLDKVIDETDEGDK